MRLGRSGPGPDQPEATPGPGTLALDAHLARNGAGPPEHRWFIQPERALPGQGPLEQVVGRRVDDHWHLVTYGLSELEAKESDDPRLSGWGFELTIRVEDDGEPAAGAAGATEGKRRRRKLGDDRPGPAWAVDLLANLATYLWTSRHAFAPGHHLALGGPIRLETDTALTAAAIVADPTLDAMDGPFGRVEFLQVVGLSAAELERCRSWSTEGVLDLLAESDPMLVIRLDRPSILDDPAVAALADERAAGDGASLTELRVGTLDCLHKAGRGSVIRMGAGTAAALGPALRRELIAEGASFQVVGDESRVRFRVGDPIWATKPGGIDLAVPLAEVEDLAKLFDGRTGWGHHRALSRLRFQVIP